MKTKEQDAVSAVQCLPQYAVQSLCAPNFFFYFCCLNQKVNAN